MQNTKVGDQPAPRLSNSNLFISNMTKSRPYLKIFKIFILSKFQINFKSMMMLKIIQKMVSDVVATFL